jgi:hypothetical protein
VRVSLVALFMRNPERLFLNRLKSLKKRDREWRGNNLLMVIELTGVRARRTFLHAEARNPSGFYGRRNG